MDQAFLDREKELYKLNAKLMKKKFFDAPKVIKPVHIVTSNNNFNYYDSMSQDEGRDKNRPKKESQDEGLELSCKKINMCHTKPKKTHEIIYPLFSRHPVKGTREPNINDIHIHMPEGLTVADSEIFESAAPDNSSVDFKNESLVTRCSDDSSAVALLEKDADHLKPSITNNVVPRSIEKKNISNDGLLK